MITAFIRSGSKAATLHPTLSAIREGNVAVDWRCSDWALSTVSIPELAGSSALCKTGCCPRHSASISYEVLGRVAAAAVIVLASVDLFASAMDRDACGL
jgi:hypothetical protein